MKKRIAGKKKVNAFKDGFFILIEMIKLFFILKFYEIKEINRQKLKFKTFFQ